MPEHNGVEFTWYHPDELAGTMQFADDASQIVMGVKVPWEHMNLACVRLIGWPELKTEGGVTYISRKLPLLYDGFIGQGDEPWLRAKSVSRVQGLGARGKMDDDSPRYKWAVIWMAFASVPYDFAEDGDDTMTFSDGLGPLALHPDEATLARYVSEAGDPFDRSVSLPRSLLRRVTEAGDTAGTYPILEGVGKLEPGTDVQITHHLRPDYPLGTILSCMGRVNSEEFAGYDPGLLVCQAPRRRVYRSPLGQRLYDVTFRFRFTAKVDQAGVLRDANHFLANVKRAAPPDTIDYRLYTTDGTGTGGKVYGDADFNDLMRPIQ